MTKIGRIWRDWKVWRTARKLEQELYPPPPEPKLNVFQTFLHLNTAGRVALVLCASQRIASTCNPHSARTSEPIFKTSSAPDGKFNVHELTLALYLSGVVLVLTMSPLLIWRAPWVTKPGLVIMAILLANASINNSSRTLKHAAELEIGTLKDKKTRMALLKAEKNAAEAAWKALPRIMRSSEATAWERQGRTRRDRESAYDECNRGIIKRGLTGETRGPKCEELEAQRKAQGEKVDKLAHDKDLTDQEDDLRRAFTVADTKLQAEGAEVESTEAPVAPFPQFLANIHIISQDIAVGWSKDQPTTDALTMEFQAWFGAPASVGLVFWIFGLFTGARTEAERRLIEVTKTVAEDRAKVVLSAAPLVERTDTGTTEMEPDHSPEAVLEIEGEEPPAFVKIRRLTQRLCQPRSTKRTKRRSRARRAPSSQRTRQRAAVLQGMHHRPARPLRVV